EKLQASEDAKDEVERSLEAMTAERDELAEKLRATEDAKREVDRKYLRLTEGYVKVRRMCTEKDLRLRVVHDYLNRGSEADVDEEKNFAVSKALLSSRRNLEKENLGQ
ncbi:myosin heavy chain, partial [Trypanosoma conorhini]